MERLDDEGQWIVLMGVVVATGMFILAIIINQAPMVGQSTSEAVLEFPKNEIQDIRYHLAPIAALGNDTDNITLEQRIHADMQLQQLGYDALLVMDTPVHDGDESRLQDLISTTNIPAFESEFDEFLRKGTGTTHMIDPPQFIVDTRTQWNATVYYHDRESDATRSYSFGNSMYGGDFVTREPAISVTRYVFLDGRPSGLPNPHNNDVNNRKQMVLLEVLLWRG